MSTDRNKNNKTSNKNNKQRAQVFRKYLFEIFPDYWNKKWGPAPSLGFIRADSEFEAIRKAYDKGLLIVNFTFGPKPVKVREFKVKSEVVSS